MIGDRPAPLLEASVDVRDMDGFMLNSERLLASELWALSTGEEFKAAVGLWCRAWKQIPAASLPNDDRVLASFAGVTLARWKKIKTMALRGFVECSDGRLYHRVLVEDAKRAAVKKAERRERTRAATEARKRERNDQRNDPPRNDRDVGVTTNVTTSQGQGQGQGQKKEVAASASSLPAANGHAPPCEAAADPRFHEVGSRVLDMIGGTKPLNYQRVQRWLAEGADPERDILPAVRHVLDRERQREPAWMPQGLKYFDPKVAEFRQARTAPMPDGGQPKPRKFEPLIP